MYQSKISLSKKTRQQNQKRIKKHIENNKYVSCHVLRRRINLSKYIYANKKRSDAFIRFASFSVGLDIIKKSKNYEEKFIDGYRCFEIIGLSSTGEIVKTYICEEMILNDRILFLISTFYK